MSAHDIGPKGTGVPSPADGDQAPSAASAIDRDSTVAARTSQRMARQARRDTGPELALRRALHRLGLRYRVDAPLPGLPRRRADLLFPGARVAVFVDGCFWHSCPLHATQPATSAQWWANKLAHNVERDRDTDTHLGSLGWEVLRFWEHEDVAAATAKVAATVRRRSGVAPTRLDDIPGSAAESVGRPSM